MVGGLRRNGPAVRPAESAGRTAGRWFGRPAGRPDRRNLTGRAEPPPRVPPVHSVQPSRIKFRMFKCCCRGHQSGIYTTTCANGTPAADGHRKPRPKRVLPDPMIPRRPHSLHRSQSTPCEPPVQSGAPRNSMGDPGRITGWIAWVHTRPTQTTHSSAGVHSRPPPQQPSANPLGSATHGIPEAMTRTGDTRARARRGPLMPWPYCNGCPHLEHTSGLPGTWTQHNTESGAGVCLGLAKGRGVADKEGTREFGGRRMSLCSKKGQILTRFLF